MPQLLLLYSPYLYHDCEKIKMIGPKREEIYGIDKLKCLRARHPLHRLLLVVGFHYCNSYEMLNLLAVG